VDETATMKRAESLDVRPTSPPAPDTGTLRASGRMPGVRDVRWWQQPLASLHAELRALASAGDMQAAHVLGARSAHCVQVLRKEAPEELTRRYEDDLEHLAGRSPASTDVRRRNAERRLREGLDRYQDCLVVGLARAHEGVDWLERAGLAGNDAARVDFAAHALAEYETRGALIADIEEASRRRQLARVWLEQGVRDGNEHALRRVTDSLAGGDGLYVRDEASFQAHAYALQLVQGRRAGTFQLLWRDGPARYGPLTEAQWAEATARGREIFSESFEHMPIRPGM
jgi:hypothetical protein